jgi:hypothetical protein
MVRGGAVRGGAGRGGTGRYRVVRDGAARGGTGWCGTGRDGAVRSGTGWCGMGRDGEVRSGAGRGGTGVGGVNHPVRSPRSPRLFHQWIRHLSVGRAVAAVLSAIVRISHTPPVQLRGSGGLPLTCRWALTLSGQCTRRRFATVVEAISRLPHTIGSSPCERITLRRRLECQSIASPEPSAVRPRDT